MRFSFTSFFGSFDRFNHSNTYNRQEEMGQTNDLLVLRFVTFPPEGVGEVALKLTNYIELLFTMYSGGDTDSIGLSILERYEGSRDNSVFQQFGCSVIEVSLSVRSPQLFLLQLSFFLFATIAILIHLFYRFL